MVDWQSPAVLANLNFVSTNMTFFLLGVYGWEYVLSLDVEYAVIRGRLAFRWPLIPYLVGRLFLFVFLLLSVIGISYPKYFACFPAALAVAIPGDVGLGCCSLNLMIRTWVIWRDSRCVHILLSLLTLGHWIMLGLDVANIRGYNSNGQCGVTFAHPTMNAVVLMYSLSYDTIVLVFSLVGLSRQPSKSPLRKRLQAQGLLYFAVAVITYIPPTIFSFLNVTPIVSVTGLSAITASTIASCRAVRSLISNCKSQTCESSKSDQGTDDGLALTTEISVHVTSIPTTAHP